MTIKQQGGVFGRNPTFNDVTVESNLVSKTLTVDGGTLFVDAVNDRVGVNETSPDTKLHLKGSGGTETSIKIENTGAGADGPWLLSAGQPGVGNTGFSIYDIANARSSFHVNSAGDARVTAGNLVIGTSGKGIDFSATAGTGTSELFDDYEEGTWTPSLAFGTSVVLNSATGTYTKMGRLVYVTFNIDVASHTQPDTSPISINGLPYNIAADIGTLFSIDPLASTFIDLTTTPLGGVKTSANTYLQLYQTDRSAISYTEAAASGKLVGAAMYEAS